MNCNEVQELFGSYWDLPTDDPRRIFMDEHIRHCPSCREEFEIWKESMDMIHNLGDTDADTDVPSIGSISSEVMERIYAEEKWRIPIAARVYHLSFRMRMRYTAIIAFCLTLFSISFLYSVFYSRFQDSGSRISDLAGIYPAANAVGDGNVMTANSNIFEGIPVASIGSPNVLKIPQVPPYPDYWIALSLLGLVCVMLVMNWFSRIKE